MVVLPYIHTNQPWVYLCSPSWSPLPSPSPSHPSGSSQCTSPKHPVSCIEPGLAVYFTCDNIHVSMLFSQIIPPSPSPTESKSLFFTSVSLLLSRIWGHRYHLSKFHIYVLIYCIGVFLSDLLHSVLLMGKYSYDLIAFSFLFDYKKNKMMINGNMGWRGTAWRLNRTLL